MASERLEEFARTLVAAVRDAAIRNCDMNLRPDARNPIAKRWRAERGDPETFGAMLAADCVDATICALLRALDQGMLRLDYRAEDGTRIDLTDDGEGRGERVGWYMGGPDGWRSHSRERVFDDLTDLYPVPESPAGTPAPPRSR